MRIQLKYSDGTIGAKLDSNSKLISERTSYRLSSGFQLLVRRDSLRPGDTVIVANDEDSTLEQIAVVKEVLRFF